jgi:hypothetical protein
MDVKDTGPLAIFYENNFNVDLSISSPINDGYAPFVDIVVPSYFSVLSAKMKLTKCTF